MGRAEPHTKGMSHGQHSEVFIGIDTSKLKNAVAVSDGQSKPVAFRPPPSSCLRHEAEAAIPPNGRARGAL